MPCIGIARGITFAFRKNEENMKEKRLEIGRKKRKEKPTGLGQWWKKMKKTKTAVRNDMWNDKEEIEKSQERMLFEWKQDFTR